VPTVADAIVTRLCAAGVRAVFGVPGGGSNLDLVDSARRAGLSFILTSTETGGAIAAQVQADLTGHPAACLTTLGPGAASVTNGVACAWLERSPLLVFTDSHAEKDHGRLEHQHLDHSAMTRAITKRSELLRASTAARAIDRAILAAVSGQPGPVHLDCPGDVLSASVSALPKGKGPRRRAVGDVDAAPPAAAVKRLMARLKDARKPILLIGLGARRAADTSRIDALIRGCGMPVMVTYKAKGVVPDDHPWFAGVFTNAAIEQPLVSQADLIIGLGLDPVELLPRAWPYRAPVVSLCPWRVPTTHVPFAERLVVDVRGAIGILERGLRRLQWDADDVRAGWQRQLAAIDLPTKGMSPQQAIRVAAGRLAKTHRLTVDAGAHMLPTTMMWPVEQPNGLLISNGLATMAYSVPAAIGAALTEPNRPVVAFIGDGGLLMCAGELRTIARERLNILTIVFNDTSLSLIEIKQIARKLPPAGVDLGSLDAAALATSMGVMGYRASNEAELDHAIARATATGGPALIDASIDRSNYPATMRAIRG
jgi:acetolactate synthase-1/2/3 large subunit